MHPGNQRETRVKMCTGVWEAKWIGQLGSYNDSSTVQLLFVLIIDLLGASCSRNSTRTTKRGHQPACGAQHSEGGHAVDKPKLSSCEASPLAKPGTLFFMPSPMVLSSKTSCFCFTGSASTHYLEILDHLIHILLGE